MSNNKQILFVDDQQNVLDGIRRMLRPMRREWDMAFAGGGREALDVMMERTFDIVVSDLQMPGMSGVELLSNRSGPSGGLLCRESTAPPPPRCQGARAIFFAILFLCL